ncbi:MAG: DUF2007 domain-containing protein [Tannerellaceae bacterium]|nr:DUF2007 domain-containing protein [Tannerellaceae bacterium]
MKNAEKMVEIARFQYPAEAYTLMALLESEGIECYLRNEQTAQLLSHLDVGGARVEILEGDVPEAMRIMQEGGYEVPGEYATLQDGYEGQSWMNRVPFIKNLSFPARIILFIVLIILLLYGLFLGGRLF